jgi:hypothetical protein
MIVGSGGGGIAFRVWLDVPLVFCEAGEASLLWARKRVVMACWRAETRAKGVVWGRWRWASLIFVVVIEVSKRMRCVCGEWSMVV